MPNRSCYHTLRVPITLAVSQRFETCHRPWPRAARVSISGSDIDMATRLDRDEELVETRRQREPAAAEQLVITYGDRAYRLASRITGNEQDAAEIVQDAFWYLVKKTDS